MTGFGSAQVSTDLLTVELHIRSLNGRYLDIQLSGPPIVYPFEAQLKRRIAEQARRGKIELQVRLVGTAPVAGFDRERAIAVAAELRSLAEELGLDQGPNLSDVLRIEGVLYPQEPTFDVNQVQPLVVEALELAIERWNASRREERQATIIDIQRHLDRLRAVHATFVARAVELEQTLWRQARRRFHDLLGPDVADEARVYQEVAALLVRYSTQEEIARLGAHLEHFGRAIDSGGGGAKRLDFLCQELNREINTTAGKTVFLDVQNAAVEGKDAVEAIREQLRNLE